MKPFTSLTIAFLALIAFVHLLRLALGWTVFVNGLTVPLWASAVALAVCATLAFMLWRENRG